MALNDSGGVRTEVFSAEMTALLRGPNGAVAQHMIRQAEAVRQEAKRLVGVHQPVPGERRARKPGTLRDSIVKRPTRGADGDIAYVVGSRDPIALLHHEGTPPHVILPKRRPRLVFYWKRVGRVVAFAKVNHPGTRPNRYLVDALKVLRRT